jgi:hypothetical protein
MTERAAKSIKEKKWTYFEAKSAITLLESKKMTSKDKVPKLIKEIKMDLFGGENRP